MKNDTSSITPLFKPKWALDLLYPIFPDTRKMRAALSDIGIPAPSSDKAAQYSPELIAKLRASADKKFASRFQDSTRQVPIIAFRSSKGGVGKTTTCANVGACAALMGYKVLMIDAAPQASLSTIYQINVEDPNLQTLKHACFDNIPFKNIIKRVLSNGDLYLIPSDNALSAFDYLAMPQMGRENILRDTFSKNSNTLKYFDLILIDCDPGTSQLNLNVLMTTTFIAAPVALDGLSLKALSQLSEELAIVEKLRNSIPEYCFIANKFYPSYSHTIDNLKIIKEEYKDLLLEVTIPEAVAFSRQIKLLDPTETMPLFLYQKEVGSPAWRAILDLTRTILRKNGIAV